MRIEEEPSLRANEEDAIPPPSTGEGKAVVLTAQHPTPTPTPALPHQGGGSAKWKKICGLHEIPRLGARVVKDGRGDIAIFRNAEDEVFALRDKCPHKGGPLSQGIVFGRKVSCPLHQWIVCLDSGHAQAPDEGAARSFRVKVEGGEVWMKNQG